MARLEAQAKGGFYPLPLHIAAALGSMLRPAWRQGAEVRLVDPCAGEGAALACLKQWIGGNSIGRPFHVNTFACEMESKRWEVLRQDDPKRQHFGHVGQHVRGDFFQLKYDVGMGDVLLLNPPYDIGWDGRRLEAWFLEAASGILVQGGALVLVVPYYVLGACAETLALHYTDPEIYRFPGADFDAFRQVVVLARKVVRSVPDPKVAAWATAMGRSVEHAPELPLLPERLLDQPNSFSAVDDTAHLRKFPAPSRSGEAFGGWGAEPCWTVMGYDVQGVAGLDPWESPRGPVAGMALPLDLAGHASAVFPVVSPVRAVHLASAIAAGAFMGVEVEPNDDAAAPSGRRLPALLVKGTFARQWVTQGANHGKDGEIVSEEQVERPQLEVWVLDLERGGYHLLENSQDTHDALDGIEGATFADLVTHYSRGLLAALRAACPVLHDPARDAEPKVTGIARPLWAAQLSAVHAADKSADPARGQGVLLMAEPGSGKTGITLALLAKRGIRRALVQVPPHLLSTWRQEAAEVRPDMDVVVIQSPGDVRAVARHPGPVIALLSREGSKLGHAVEAVGPLVTEAAPEPSTRLAPACPRCGADLPSGKIAEKRLRCTAPVLSPTATSAPLAAWLRKHLLLLVRWRPDHAGLASLLPRTRAMSRWRAWAAMHPAGAEVLAQVESAAVELVGVLLGWGHALIALPYRLAWALPRAAQAMLQALPVWGQSNGDIVEREPALFRARELVGLTLPPGEPFELTAHPDGQRHAHGEGKPLPVLWKDWADVRLWVHGQWVSSSGARPARAHDYEARSNGAGRGFEVGTLFGNPRGSASAVSHALDTLVTWADLQPRKLAHSVAVEHKPAAVLCGEPLFQAVPRPRRVPLGTFIAQHARGVFDAYVMDEVQELASETSAQGIVSARLARAAHRDQALLVYLTGSIDNGYADSLFHALWALSPDFRAQYKPCDRERFAELYGLRRRVVLHASKVKNTGAPVARGAQSERVTDGSIRMTGFAPGVLPTGVLEHVLARAVILHKADLEINLPALTQHTVDVPLLREQRANMDAMRKVVTRVIGLLRFQAGCAGKLFGAVTKLIHYPDLAAVGNEPGGTYELRCPQSMPEVSVGDFHLGPGAVLMRVPALPREDLLPKEVAMLARVRAELAEGRGCLVLPVSASLLERYAWIFDQAGIDAALLVADKVPPAKREAWIAKKLGQDKRRVLIVNPDAVRTGLNGLAEHLSTAICMQNPDCKPITDRQVIDRLHRPKQRQPVRAFRMVYEHALPQMAHRLLMHKVGVSLAVDGLDPEAVYAAAGIGDQISAGLSVGHQLYRLLCEQAGEDGE